MKAFTCCDLCDEFASVFCNLKTTFEPFQLFQQKVTKLTKIIYQSYLFSIFVSFQLSLLLFIYPLLFSNIVILYMQ